MASQLLQQCEVKVVALKKMLENADYFREILCDFKTWYECEGLIKNTTDAYGKLVKQYNDEVHNDLFCGLENFIKMDTVPVRDHSKTVKILPLVKCLRSLPSKVPSKYVRVKEVAKFGNMASDLSSALEAMKKYPDVMAVFFIKADRPSTGDSQTPAKSNRPLYVHGGSGANQKWPASVSKGVVGEISRPQSAKKGQMPDQCQNCINLLKKLEKQKMRITHLENNVLALTKENNKKSIAIRDAEKWVKTLTSENKKLKKQHDILEADKVKLEECLDKVRSSKEQKALMDTLLSDKLLQTREKHMREMEEIFEQELKYRDGKIQQMQEELVNLADRRSDESAIENISIKHRPMTIAENYYNFCSNAWLDTKMMLDEKLSKKEEEDVLKFLNSVLEIASTKTAVAFEDLFRFLNLQLLCPGALIQEGKVRAKGGTLPVEVSQVLGDYLKVTSDKADLSTLTSDVKKTLEQQKSKFVTLLEDEVMSAYILEACVIGWQMAIQRPSMEFRWEGVGKAWQEVLQEPYWRCDPYKEGATVKYYVHPSLHHGGAVLVKGKVYID